MTIIIIYNTQCDEELMLSINLLCTYDMALKILLPHSFDPNIFGVFKLSIVRRITFYEI